MPLTEEVEELKIRVSTIRAVQAEIVAQLAEQFGDKHEYIAKITERIERKYAQIDGATALLRDVRAHLGDAISPPESA